MTPYATSPLDRETTRSARRRTLRALGLTLLLGLAFAPFPTRAESKGEIRVRVVGLRSDQGSLRFGLYNRKETFATSDGPIVKGVRPIKDRRCEFVIPDVPHGTYALIVGHDVDGDGKISRNPFSAELKGISNYSGKILSFPDFDRARFQLSAPQLTVEIRVY